MRCGASSELAGLIGQMWLQRHPKQNVLADVPDVASTDGIQWAEFRISATTHRSYETRRFDRPGWMRATGLTQAAETTCAKVGYALPRPTHHDSAGRIRGRSPRGD